MEIYYVLLFYVVDVSYKSNFDILNIFSLALIRNSYTQYLIALAIVDTGAIFSESKKRNFL